MIQALRRLFSGHLRRRRRRGHVGRAPLLETLPRRTGAPPLVPALQAAALATPAQALAAQHSTEHGLSVAQARARRARAGPNAIAHEPPLPWWRHLWQCWANPFNLLLSALALLSYVGGDRRGTVVIGSMVALSTLLRFVQEGRSHRAAESLQALVHTTATVLRPGSGDGPAQRVDVPQRSLVPGDVVALSAGDMVPADCRVLGARDLFIAQAAMTGESQPVEKFATAGAADRPALEQANLVFMGTNVVSGTATALVVATGGQTAFGALAARATATDAGPNAFQAGVDSVSWLLVRFALVMVPLVLLVNGFTKGDWLQAALFAMSVAVGLTPEMLPMIVTTTLAKGAVVLSRRKVIVKRLDAIQSLGAMDVLCTDKTGTLTQDRIALARHSDAFGAPSDAVLTRAYLNSHFQTGLKNLLDHAVLEHVDLAETLQLAQDWRKVDEIPFDFERRRMSVVVAQRGQAPELICKGAVEEVLAICTQVRGDGGRDVPLDAALLERVHRSIAAMNAEGLRVVAVAVKRIAPSAPEQTVFSVADEAALTLIGTIAFLDPPKESATPALRALATHGIRVKVLSGDNEAVTAHVCAQVGLPSAPVLLGAQVQAMDDAALVQAAAQHDVYAKLSPLHKERVVRALRSAGHVVGFMGDGINDAPALRAADVGISVDTAVDIAKEAADVILLEKSLLVLDEGVIEGRTTFANLLKYIRMAASSNFGNVLSVLVASALLPFLPMLPLQLLVQNLLYDVAQTGIPFDRVDAEQLAQPLHWNPGEIGRFMLCFGPVSSVFDLLLFAVMWWGLGADTVAEQGLFQSGWFVVGLLTQTLVVHVIRTAKLPLVQSRAATPLLVSTGIVIALGLWLPMGPLAAAFGLQPLPAPFFAWLAALLAGYALLTTVVKRLFVRRFGWQ